MAVVSNLNGDRIKLVMGHKHGETFVLLQEEVAIFQNLLNFIS